MTTTPTVLILTFCHNLNLLYGTTLIFSTLRVGFPNARVLVVDNASLSPAREEIRRLALQQGCEHIQRQDLIQHQLFLREAVLSLQGPVVFVDPDIMLWQSIEDWDFGNSLMAGRLIPRFFDDATKTDTAPRLHTSLLWVPSVERLKDRLLALNKQYFDFHPFRPVMLRLNGRWHRFDTGAEIYAAIPEELHVFGEQELNAYDHLFCGTHFDFVYARMSDTEDTREWGEHHRAAQADYRSLRGIWRWQDDYFRRQSASCVELKRGPATQDVPDPNWCGISPDVTEGTHA